jgi:hypothetical protein
VVSALHHEVLATVAGHGEAASTATVREYLPDDAGAPSFRAVARVLGDLRRRGLVSSRPFQPYRGVTRRGHLWSIAP